jgi:hypothetical protein
MNNSKLLTMIFFISLIVSSINTIFYVELSWCLLFWLLRWLVWTSKHSFNPIKLCWLSVTSLTLTSKTVSRKCYVQLFWICFSEKITMRSNIAVWDIASIIVDHFLQSDWTKKSFLTALEMIIFRTFSETFARYLFSFMLNVQFEVISCSVVVLSNNSNHLIIISTFELKYRSW